MHQIDPFSIEFARDMPDAFARTCARGEPAEISQVLDSLPDSLAASIAARLPLSRMQALLAAGLARPEVWLAAASFDDATALMGMLPRDQCVALVNGLADRDRRRKIRQYLNYPARSVGALASDEMLRIADDLSIADLRQELHALEDTRFEQAIIVETEGKYFGVLNLWRMTVEDSDNRPVRHCADRVPSLNPEASVFNAVKAEAWAEHAWLPVVDHENRVLGVASRSRVFAALGATREEASIIHDSITGLGEQYLGVMSEFLGWLLAPRRTS